MKLERTFPSEPIGFRPIAITLTIETQKEFEVLNDMTHCNVNIPLAVIDSGYTRYQSPEEKNAAYNLVQLFLDSLQVQLHSDWKKASKTK